MKPSEKTHAIVKDLIRDLQSAKWNEGTIWEKNILGELRVIEQQLQQMANQPSFVWVAIGDSPFQMRTHVGSVTGRICLQTDGQSTGKFTGYVNWGQSTMTSPIDFGTLAEAQEWCQKQMVWVGTPPPPPVFAPTKREWALVLGDHSGVSIANMYVLMDGDLAYTVFHCMDGVHKGLWAAHARSGLGRVYKNIILGHCDSREDAVKACEWHMETRMKV